MSKIGAQRALEALRNGVPNDDAVRALGCMQPTVMDRFRGQLKQLAADPAEGTAPCVPGMLISGDFGTGKSHTLSCLEHEALSRNFVVSRLVISKETPLHDPAKIFLAAVREARLPNGRGSLLHELATGINYRSRPASSFYAWATTVQPYPMVAASVLIDERSNDAELQGQVVNWWSGDKLSVGQIRTGMRGIGLNDKSIKQINVRDLTPIRFEFAARLARARGYAGWVLLLDEIELIARFSLLQRAKSYAELARWVGVADGQNIPGVTVVASITLDYHIAVLGEQGKNDRQIAPDRMSKKGDAASKLLAVMSALGIKVIDKDRVELQQVTDDTLAISFHKLRELYQEAYDFTPSDKLDLPTKGPLMPMRSYVRRWITSWDLSRLYGDVQHPGIEEQQMPQQYHEDPEAMEEVEERAELAE
jgi:hypothetical protein